MLTLSMTPCLHFTERTNRVACFAATLTLFRTSMVWRWKEGRGEIASNKVPSSYILISLILILSSRSKSVSVKRLFVLVPSFLFALFCCLHELMCHCIFTQPKSTVSTPIPAELYKNRRPKMSTAYFHPCWYFYSLYRP